MNNKDNLGGIIHTYQKYNPAEFPSPTAPPPDLVSPAFEHLLAYGEMRELTEEELARAVRLDPSQIANLGPTIQSLQESLLERKRKILQTYETSHAEAEAAKQYRDLAESITPPKPLAQRFRQAVKHEQVYEIENLYYEAGKDRDFARQIVKLADVLGQKYQVDELASKYQFTGRERMSVPKALEIKHELETIDKLLKQLEQAKQTAQLAIIDMETLAEMLPPGDVQQLGELQQQVNNLLRELAERQGLEQGKPGGGFRMTPRAYRLFQSKLLSTIFSEMQASRTGRHQLPVEGEGAVEMQQTKPYEFGDSVSQMDIPGSMINAMLRCASEQPGGVRLPVRMKPEDIQIHRTRNNPKAATAVLLDMSGSMRYDAQYINVKRMGLALDGLIRSEYPGDFLQFIEIYSFAKPRHVSELATLMPKPVTLHSPVVRLKANLADPNVTESKIPPHFTNIQHGLALARKFLANQDTPNRQIILITDGLPTAHFEGEMLYLFYPPDPRTENATLREAQLCQRDGITINIFLLASWNQTEQDVRFAYRLAETTKGRVFFTAGRELDRYVVWDYVKMRRSIVS
jgi:uncharacterized protein with von Willebrand factor type A (vWA) domain